jgi:hypothetical protein
MYCTKKNMANLIGTAWIVALLQFQFRRWIRVSAKSNELAMKMFRRDKKENVFYYFFPSFIILEAKLPIYGNCFRPAKLGGF